VLVGAVAAVMLEAVLRQMVVEPGEQPAALEL
jgi:hypothetical protein